MAGTSRRARRRTPERTAERGTMRQVAGAGEDIRKLARDAAVAAIARLRALSDSDDERVALAATQELLNRAFGKVGTSGGEEQGGGTQPPLVIKIVRFGAGEDAAESASTAAGKPGEAS